MDRGYWQRGRKDLVGIQQNSSRHGYGPLHS